MSGNKHKILTLNVNGRDYDILGVEDQMTLADVLRDKLGLTGTKVACDDGACGSCTVIVDGKPTLSCMTLAVTMAGKSILTIEGLLKENTPHPIQQAFIETGAIQCGYCTPAQILVSKEILGRKLNPTEEEVRDALSGVLCRCTGYLKPVQAVMRAAAVMRGEEVESIRELPPESPDAEFWASIEGGEPGSDPGNFDSPDVNTITRVMQLPIPREPL